MAIIFEKQQQIFHLYNSEISYVMQVVDGYLLHVYFGRKLTRINPVGLVKTSERPWSPNPTTYGCGFALDSAQHEYMTDGRMDFRSPALIVFQNGFKADLELKYKSHNITKGKPKLHQLPATYIENEEEAQTLEICLYDELYRVEVYLSYTIFGNRSAIVRSTRIRNSGKTPISLSKVQSASIDFADSNFEILHLSGAWARECGIVRQPIWQGEYRIASARGISGHVHNPFVALMRPMATETSGEVYGFSLVYSGNFEACVEAGEFLTTRVGIGINSHNFSWHLAQGESFQTPEVVMVFSSCGLGAMSRTYHNLYRECLCRGLWKDKPRPIIMNNWEATYFDYDKNKLVQLAKAGKDIGAELFVLDDGWFGKRNNDLCSLGDWQVNEKKLRGTMAELAKEINAEGLMFGLWFEPEMISPDSDLYRAHPDYCLAYPGRLPVMTRNQLVLDLSRKDVCDAVYDMMVEVLSKANVVYVKWDMNRNLTDVYSANLPNENQGELAHRYILGVYGLMERLTMRFPEILFEGCAGGGGRCDPGILYYMPQIWISDNTDAIERTKIQYGVSLVYPPSAMDCNVSDVPNHQVGRTAPIETRGNVAMCGNLGYQLDLTKISDTDRGSIKGQVEFYKKHRHMITYGDFYRLSSPFDSSFAAWQTVDKDKSESILLYINMLSTPNVLQTRIRLQGLDPIKEYSIDGLEGRFGGDQLMYAGIDLPALKDFESILYHIIEVEKL